MRLIALIAFGVLVIDQVTKTLALKLLPINSSIELVPNILRLSMVRNTGIAFGLFRSHPELLSLLISGGVLALVLGAIWFQRQTSAKRLAYGFILGGALGNWLDRVRFHSVTDFLDFRIWPVFNGADSFITAGVLLMILLAFRSR